MAIPMTLENPDVFHTLSSDDDAENNEATKITSEHKETFKEKSDEFKQNF
jgi:hypothetical protein